MEYEADTSAQTGVESTSDAKYGLQVDNANCISSAVGMSRCVSRLFLKELKVD